MQLDEWMRVAVEKHGKVILVTGSRDWPFGIHIKNALLARGPAGVLHGGASGADALAGYAAFKLGWERFAEHPDYNSYPGKQAPKMRNQKMVDALVLGRDQVIAFPLPSSRGTWDCINKARARGFDVWVYDHG